MRWKFWFLLLLLFSSAYLAYRWYDRQQNQPFELELVALDTALINWFSVVQAGQTEEWIFKREGEHWLLSNGSATVQPESGKVEHLLAACSRFVSDSIAAKSTDKALFDEDKAFRFRFYQGKRQLAAFSLWPPKEDDVYARAYLQQQSGSEIFLIHEGEHQACWEPLENYLYKKMLPFSWQEVSYVALSDTTGLRLQAFRHDSLWLDSLGNHISHQGLHQLHAKTTTSGFRFRSGQIPPAEKQWSLLLGTGQSDTLRILPDSLSYLPKGYVQIDVFCDSSSTVPFFYTSSLYPGEYFQADSSDIIQALLRPLFVER